MEYNTNDGRTYQTGRPNQEPKPYRGETQYSHRNPQLITEEELETLSLADYGLTAEAIRSDLYGIDVKDPQTGEPLPDSFYEDKIQKAIAQVEQKLDIAIFPRMVHEDHDLYSQNVNSYMYTHVYKRPIVQVEQMGIQYHEQYVRNYPSKWWSVYNLSGHIEIMPGIGTHALHANIHGGFNGGMVGYGYSGGVNPTSSFQRTGGFIGGGGKTFAPQLVHVEYIAGLLPRKSGAFNHEWEMSASLENLILKVASREVIKVWGRTLFPTGIQSHSINMDGISETVNSTNSAKYNVASSYLSEIDAEINDLYDTLKGYFGDSYTQV